MKDTPIKKEIVDQILSENRITNVTKASIREIKKLINLIEDKSGQKFIRMEMGIPGLPTPKIAIEAEKKAIDEGATALYPDLDGIPELKKQISVFIKNFLDVDIKPLACIPTVGSINGAFATFMVAGRMNASQDTILFIDPGFPVHKQLVKMIGLKQENFDVYNFRGHKLREKLESILKQGNISVILYSNPNNPSWICFNEEELQIIGELATKYNVVVAEDLAYFAMDFRKDISTPGFPPFQATVAKYTDNYILMISTSKSFSYAGQRVGICAISDKLFNSEHPDLLKYYSSSNFGHALVHGTVYAVTAGTSHSAQYGVAALLKAANEGSYNFVKETREYGERANMLKKIFINNGFKIVYDMDLDKPIADGFYFTISYPGLSGEELLRELLYYGVSAISLGITGSERTEGLRACVSLIQRAQFDILENRLKIFSENHK
ncbi:MAG TPA: pyridoxal phosphate-dependent aminotransferase [Bacteroidales bacterium]|nr:pyridoxal phosphate-dependent aminotransferase [Bacteroidales bacterium]HQI44653.1 pyridoxal phosphate-dependent aminotransferase [Bacteroidales bacterium]